MKRIVCVGNRYRLQDALGPLVYDHLQHQPMPREVEVIDGGLGGLNLLPLVDGTERVIFVDTIEGFCQPGGVVVLNLEEARQLAPPTYDHAAGLAYLLGVLEEVCTERVPEVFVLGIEGTPDIAAVKMAADLALNLVQRGSPFDVEMGRSCIRGGQ